MIVEPAVSWEIGIRKAFEIIIASTSKNSIQKNIDNRMAAQAVVISQIDKAVRGLFSESLAKDTRISFSHEVPFEMFWVAKQRRIFVICTPPMPTIQSSGGWKKGYIALMFDDEKQAVDLVWSLEMQAKNIKPAQFVFKELELQKKYGDTEFWPKVYHEHYFRDYKKVSKPIDRTFLFSMRYECTLNEAFKLRRLSNEIIVTVIHQVSLALNFIHKNELAHCDIKPLNILLGKRAVLCDWDLLVEKGKTTPLFAMYGTPYYASPECIEDNGKVLDFRPSDQYALGVSLHLYTSKDVCNAVGNKKNKYFEMKHSKSATSSHVLEKSLNEILYLLNMRSSDSDKALDALKGGKIELKDFTSFLRDALLHPVADSRPTSSSVVEWSARYEKSYVENITESIRKTSS